MSNQDGFSAARRVVDEEVRRVLHRVSKSVFYLVGIGTTVIAVVAADMVERYLTNPPRPLQDAQQFQRDANNFALAEGRAAHDLKNAAANQESATYVLASAMTTGEPIPNVQRALNEVPNGLRTIHNNYLGTIDDLRALVTAGVNQLRQSQMKNFKAYIDAVANATEQNFVCLESLARAYSPPSDTRPRDVRCMINSRQYYVVRERLHSIDACETAIGTSLRDVSDRLAGYAQRRVQSAESNWEFWRMWQVQVEEAPANAIPSDTWTRTSGVLDQNCRNVPQPKLHNLTADTASLYPTIEAPAAAPPVQQAIIPAQVPAVVQTERPAGRRKCFLIFCWTSHDDEATTEGGSQPDHETTTNQ